MWNLTFLLSALLCDSFEAVQHYREIAPAFAVSMRSGFLGGIEFSDRNFRGRGQRLAVSASRSQSEGYEVEVRERRKAELFMEKGFLICSAFYIAHEGHMSYSYFGEIFGCVACGSRWDEN